MTGSSHTLSPSSVKLGTPSTTAAATTTMMATIATAVPVTINPTTSTTYGTVSPTPQTEDQDKDEQAKGPQPNPLCLARGRYDAADLPPALIDYFNEQACGSIAVRVPSGTELIPGGSLLDIETGELLRWGWDGNGSTTHPGETNH